MSTVIGLDLSLTRTGIAFWRNDTMATWSVGHGTVNAKSYPERNRRIISQLTAVVRTIHRDPDNPPYDLAVIEGPILHGPNNGAFFDRAGLWHGVYSQLAAWKIPTAVVNNATLKAWATGNGHADKPMMLAAARQWCRPMNHDEADSAWLAAFGAFHLGDQMPFPVKDRHTNSLEKVDWPAVRAMSELGDAMRDQVER